MFFFYHDLFWDDNFLPQKFNGENVFVDETILNTINSLCSKNEAYIEVNPNNLSDRNYLKLVNDNADKIVHFDLSSRSIK